MNKETVKKLLLSDNHEDNMIGMSIVIADHKTLNNIRWALFDVVGFEGGYLRANIDTQLTDRAAELILSHPILDTWKKK